MAGRVFSALVILLALGEACLFEKDATNDGLSRRAIQPSSVVFRKLKSTFIKLGKGPSWGRPGSSRSSSKLDIVFVMDKSGSIGSRNFNLAKQFVTDLIEYFPVFPAKTRVALVSYSTTVKLEFNFKKYLNRECLRKGIRNIKYTGGMTATGDALKYIRRRLIFSSAAGARRSARKVIFVLTDGRSNRGVTPRVPANNLKRRRVTIFALGITNSVRYRELLSIASGSQYVFQVRSFADLNRVARLLRRDISRKCRYGQVVYDECGRRCRCRRGKLVQCCRLRKEFTDMSYTERVRYINTVKTASKSPAYKAKYEQLLTIHKTFFDSNIHELHFFLPWHRWFILQYENLLREIDCRVTVPYWDWSLVGASPFTSDFWNTGPQGFGGDGSGSQNCVNTGPFRAAVWSVIASAGGGCLTRNFNGVAPDAVAVASLISSNSAATDFNNFEVSLRFDFHDEVHCIIDGIMCSRDSASAPEFFLHHGFVDKIWWDWQRKSNAHKFNTFFMTQAATMPSTVYRSRDFLDLNNQPGCVCAEYIDPQKNDYKVIKGMTRAQLKSIPRLPMPPVSTKAARLFRHSRAETRLASRMRAAIAPTRRLTKSALKGRDAVRGFKWTDVTRARAAGSRRAKGAADEEKNYEDSSKETLQ